MNSNKSHNKHLFLIIILFCMMFVRPLMSIGAVIPSSNQNYIITYSPNEAISANSDLSGMDNSKTCPVIQYFDGLGRPIQTIAVGETPNGSDLVSYIEYDDSGRPEKSWLPFALSSNNGALVNPTNISSLVNSFYNNTNGIPSDPKPYSINVYEPSPLNRVIKEYGPGASWQDNAKGVSHFWYTNDQSDSLIVFKFSVNPSDMLQKDGVYSNGSINIKSDLDEDGHKTWTFIDKQGQTILTRTYNNAGNAGENGFYSTYYIYDDFNRLRFVMPPMASTALSSVGTLWDPNNSEHDNNDYSLFGYYYLYDVHGNCILKKLPGAKPIKMVYDKADRLVLSQDGNQRSRNSWLFCKYDALGRPIMNGSIILDPTTQSHNILIDYYKNELVVESYGTSNTTNFGYSNTYFSGREILNEVFYYDDYSYQTGSWVSSAKYSVLRWDRPENLDPRYENVKGLLTGHINSLSSNQNYKTYKAIYYDKKGRIVAEKSTNQINPNTATILITGFDNYAYSYDFKGNVLHTLHKHKALPVTYTLTEGTMQGYDHAGRKKWTQHYLTSIGNAITTSTDEYNELGLLRTHLLGNHLETQTYDYNIRGWLTSMVGSCFVEKLYYETKPNGTGYYNGNISQSNIRYHAGDYNASRALGLTSTTGGVGFQYNYTYDDLNRLKLAVTPNSSQTPNGIYAYGEQLSYDLNGNITDLGRGGVYQHNWENAYTPDHDFLVLDDLCSSNYVGNQIQSYYDGGIDANYTGSLDFKYNPNYTPQYYYDDNGNMRANLNKNISTIQYNQLNLPETVQFSYGQMVSYSYDATGKKILVVRRIPTQNSLPAMPIGSTLYYNNTPGYTVNSTIATMYFDNVIYENGTVSSSGLFSGGAITKLQIPDGIMTRTNSTSISTPTFKSNYYIKDHLGNVRVVLDETNTIQQVNNYYPFGMEFGESAENQTKLNYQNYLAGGKEFDRKFEMNTYDFGARTYDASIGRWTTMDPLAEKYYSISPYAYCANNPIKYIDYNGDSLTVKDMESILSIFHGLAEGSNITMKFNNGVLDPSSIAEQAKNSSDVFLKDIYEIATNDFMVELSTAEKVNFVSENGEKQNYTFDAPIEENTNVYGETYEKYLRNTAHQPTGFGINGILGQVLYPKEVGAARTSTNKNIQVIVNAKGSLNHRAIGFQHEFGHVILFMRKLPHGHTDGPSVDQFIDGRTIIMKKRFGYDF